MEDFAGYERDQLHTGGRNACQTKPAIDPEIAAMRDVQARVEEAELLREIRKLRAADIRDHAGVETKLIIAGIMGILGTMYTGAQAGALAFLAGVIWLGGIWLLLSLTGALWTVTKAGCIAFWALGVPFVIVLGVTTKVVGPWALRIAGMAGLVLMAFQIIPVLAEGGRAKGVIATFATVIALLLVFAYYGETASAALARLMAK